nr:PREDICTED: uncharacterized protein LOC103314255 [Tribolium castaneum]|eukprot:XP_015839321.1 PREDICTED: uncharacterized protein LOC103314255 [Tribolium castaneum]
MLLPGRHGLQLFGVFVFRYHHNACSPPGGFLRSHIPSCSQATEANRDNEPRKRLILHQLLIGRDNAANARRCSKTRSESNAKPGHYTFCNDCKVDSTFMFSCIILSHLNSAGNPLLYAYHLRDFRAALKNFFCNLFGYSEAQVVPSHKRTSYNNYTNCRTDRLCNRSHNHSQIYYRKKSIDQVLTIVAATAGEPPNREMWNIPEASSNSSDSLKHHNEKISIVRPETPYCVKPNSLVNQGYVETSSLDDDDVFIDETFPFNEFNYDELDTNLTEKLKREVQVKTLSNSSPQLSRNLFLVEDNCKTQFMRSCSLVENELKANRITSPFREMFKKKPKLGRSLSDEGTTSNESIQRKPNGNVIRSSCGS